MNSSNKFEFTSTLKSRFLILLVGGLILAAIGYFAANATPERFWANFLLDSVFFLGISVLAVFFLAANQIGLSGWYIMVRRIFEAMSQFIKVGAVFMLIIIIGVWAGYHNLYHHWSDDFIKKQTVTTQELHQYESDHAAELNAEPMHINTDKAEAPAEAKMVVMDEAPAANDAGEIANPYYDRIIDAKSGYLNKFGWTARAIIYLALWLFIAIKLRQISLAEDADKHVGIQWYLKAKFWSAIFLVIWAVSSSMMAWDWVMSLDPHWYSTMFGWYNFISLWVASIATAILMLIYLKKRGYMKPLNENHLHNLGMFMFAFSVFWTYLWFSQFMLIWYGNLPEETHWFLMRARTDYRPLFFVNIGMNFLFPFLVLMKRGAKRNITVLTIVAAVLICTHWLDFYMMIMPAVVGEPGSRIGLLELGMFMAYAGLFLYVVFDALSKASLIPEKHPFYKESLHHHI